MSGDSATPLSTAFSVREVRLEMLFGKVCRDFAASSDVCKEARELAGLPL
jgi:hypothetical protein